MNKRTQPKGEGNPKVAVVILNWNGRLFLEQFLPSVVQATYPNMEVWVADNNSTDDSVSWVEEHFREVHIIRIPKNEGFTRGYNTALAQIKADYYVLLNQDVEVEAGWIEPIIERMEEDPALGICQPKIKAHYDRDSLEYAGAAGGFIDRFGYPFCRGRIFNSLEKDRGQYDEEREIFWATGAALFIRAGLYHQIGGLEDEFFAHMEEIDLCWRVKKAGYRIACCPQSVVYHVGGGSLPRENPRKIYLNYRNNLRMLIKNWPLHSLIWKLPLRFALDFIAFVKAFLQMKTGEFTAIARADTRMVLEFFHWLHKRKENRALIAKTSIGKSREFRGGYYRASVVWQYFIRRRHYFSQLNQRFFRT